MRLCYRNSCWLLLFVGGLIGVLAFVWGFFVCVCFMGIFCLLWVLSWLFGAAKRYN